MANKPPFPAETIHPFDSEILIVDKTEIINDPDEPKVWTRMKLTGPERTGRYIADPKIANRDFPRISLHILVEPHLALKPGELVRIYLEKIAVEVTYAKDAPTKELAPEHAHSSGRPSRPLTSRDEPTEELAPAGVELDQP